MLRALGHPVETCCDMLGVVGSKWKMVNFFFYATSADVAWCCNRLAGFMQQCCARACALVRFNTSQQGGQCVCNMLRPTMLRYVALKSRDRLSGAYKCWANNVRVFIKLHGCHYRKLSIMHLAYKLCQPWQILKSCVSTHSVFSVSIEKGLFAYKTTVKKSKIEFTYRAPYSTNLVVGLCDSAI